MLKQVKQEDIIKASQERDQQRQNAYRSTSQAANNKKSGISTAKTRTTTQKKTTSKSKSKFSDSPLFTAAKKFLSANDDAAEMTYGVYNPKASERTRAGNTLGAAGKSYQAGQANALAFLLGQDQDKVDKTRADARKYMIEHGYAKASDFGESKTDKWLAEQSGKLTDSARRLNAEAAEHEAAAKQGLGKAGQTLVDVGIAGSQMLLDAGVGALTGTGMLSMGSRTFGQATREALDNGATRGQAALYGAGSAAVEVGTEKLFDAVKLFGGGATDDLLEAAVSKLAKTDAGRTALRAVGNMGGEAVEELISGIVNPVLRASYDPNAMKDYKTREYWTDNLHDALVGAILGAAGAGGSIITGQNAVNNAALRQQETAQAAQAEAQRMAEYNQRQQRQRDYFAGNTMQTGTADAEAAVVLNRNARARGDLPAMIAEVVKATPDPARAVQNLQAMQTQQIQQNATQAAPAASTGVQELEAAKQAIGRNPTFDDLINYYSQQGEIGVQAYQKIADAFQNGELVDGGNSGIYTRAEIEQRQTSMPEADHIDNRTPEYNSKVSTKPFQLTHPELHPYFAEAAKALQQEAVNSFMSDMPSLKGGKNYYISRGLRQVMDMTGLSRQQISQCCQDIIDNHGAEDYASAKHVEMALDYIMTNGAQFQNAHFDSNPAYMEAKGKITGGTDPNTFDYALEHEYGDLIAMEEMTVDEARADWERNHPQQTPANQANAAFAEQTPANQANAAFAEQTPANQANAEPAVTPESSVGAAQEGYDPYSAWQNQSDEFHPEGEIPARQVDLPTENLQGQRTMRGGRTVMEAEATPDNRVSEIERLYTDGGLAYVPVSNEQLARDAEQAIEENGWQQSLNDWTAAVRAGQTSPELVAMGATLLNNAGNSNANAETYLSLVQDYVNLTHGTAQALQATRILKRLTPESRLFMIERELNDNPGNEHLNERQRNQLHDFCREWSNIQQGQNDQLLDLIRALNAQRRTGGLFTPRRTGNTLNRTLQSVIQQEGGFDYLWDVAHAQILGLSSDATPLSPIEAVKSVRYQAMLSKLTTVMRNLVGNNVFDPTESMSNNIGLIADLFMSLRTGRRSTALDASWLSRSKRRGSTEAMQRAYIEAALDADVSGIENRYENTPGRTFKMASRNPLTRFLSTVEKWQSYALNVTDEFQKGGIEAETQRGINSLERRGLLESGALDGWAEETARERTFQNNGRMANSLVGFRNAANNLYSITDRRGGSFGLGDAILPFARVPANVVGQFMNYSPAGLVRGTRQMLDVMIRGQNATAQEQAAAARAFGRGINGTAILTFFAAAAANGLLNVADGGDDDDEKDLARLRQTEGVTGTQLNLSAAKRWLDGESTEWRNDDDLMNIGFLEPINGLMALGSLIWDSAQDEEGITAGDIGSATAEAALQAISDLPAVSSLTNIFNNYKYSTAEDTGGKVAETAVKFLGDTATSIIPNALSGIAQGMDEGTVRDTYSSEKSGIPGVLENTLNAAKAKIPGEKGRESLPTSLDNFGQERKTTASPFMNWLNSNILPGSITKYQTNAVKQELERLMESGADVSIPNRSPEKKVDTKNGEKKLTTSEKRNYQKTYGGETFKGLNELFQSSAYKSLNDDEKAEAEKNVVSFATAKAKQSVGGKAEDPKWATKSDGTMAQNAVYNAQYKTARNTAKQATGKDNPSDGEVLVSLSNRGLDYDTTVKIMAQFMEPNTIKKYETAYADGYDFGLSAAFSGAYYEKSYDFGTTDSGNPKQRGKDNTIQWAQENLDLTRSQAIMLYNYLIKR